MNDRVITENDKRAIRLHCDWARRNGAGEQTLMHRRENLRRMAERLPVDLLAATGEHLDTWQSSILARGLTLSTMRTYTSHTRSFYAWAVEAGHLDIDPSARLPFPAVPPGKPRPVGEPDLQILLQHAEEPLRTWILLGAFMGLRSHEVAQIRGDDVTERDGRLYLSGVGKGRKPYVLAVPREVAQRLSVHLGVDRGQLWRAPRGGPLRAHHVTQQFGVYCRGLGMSYVFHCLRHRFGTRMYAATRDLLITQDAMRHASPDNTRVYVLITETATTAAMDRLSKDLRGPSPKRKRKSPRTDAA